ncbi:hypothetical protein Ae201684_016535 [Aphanomyces euteiches]|uniref:Ras-GAP domain-containing protein n=1 Tax=Aphanomyces euteiches TaxID=100861 RepID=A0A6G0WEU7_9STRA|nr:hypothetical protein Ae201684_016535 [Aphanomyces euteiches]KAH9134401.1 hypothetical protein AeRB84_019854 [Aphanomyces euteiches]KAH9140621.1 hypothetical protein AeRB84_015162 [Aphanomyces euteiches]KAH9144841.1 hypothetical protein AeRB84_011214 [Aphanomyces euteiches]KAH9150399.1 hypothetical protein AeRB84_006743 [Aphanomyces euteiches]
MDSEMPPSVTDEPPDSIRGLSLDNESLSPTWMQTLTSDPDFELARQLLDRPGDIKQLTKAYMCLFENNQYIAFLRCMIDNEVAQSEESNALMRGNTPTMKVLTEFAYTVGAEFLQEVLADPLTQLIFRSTQSLEVNHLVVEDADQLHDHQVQLEAMAQTILDRLVATPFPPPLSSICVALRRSVASRFHVHTDAVMGGFLFLRVLCPVIIKPYHSCVFPTLDKASVAPHALRSSILVAKLLQNLANNALFKEDYMAVFNPFIRCNFPTVVAFYDRICSDTSTDLSWSPSLMDVSTALEIVQDRYKSYVSTTAAISSPQSPLTALDNNAKVDMSVTLSLDRNKRRPLSSLELTAQTSFLSHRGVDTPETEPPPAHELVVQVQYDEMAHRGLMSLVRAIDDPSGWVSVQEKQSVAVLSRKRKNLYELKATVCIEEEPSTCLAFIASPCGRELWSTWGHEVRQIEQVDESSQVVHRTNYGSKIPKFLLWCCMQLQDACELETLFSPSLTGDYALVFQTMARADVPPAAGVVRSHIYSSGFIVRPENSLSRSTSLVTFAIRMEHDLMPLQAKPYQKQILTLTKLKQAIERRL